MKTISLRQPWAYLICSGIKDIENRTWRCPQKYIGQRVLIHASGTAAKEPYMLFNDDQAEQIGDRIMDVVASYHTRSAIIGSVEIVDCVINHPSIWAEKSNGVMVGHAFVYKSNEKPIWNWVLANPILFDKPILNVKGKLGFWDYDLPEEYETILKL
jgi:hypothetical protein